MAVSLAVVLWFQFAYAIWQFVRVAKFCRLPYAVLVHTFMWLIGRWGRPFAARDFIVLDPPRERYYISQHAAGMLIDRWNKSKKGRDCVFDNSVSELENDDLEKGYQGKLKRLRVQDAGEGLNFHLCSRRMEYSFVWNYLRDEPDCFARTADLIFPKFMILDRVRHEDGLKKICLGESIPSVSMRRRFLAVPDRERELNQNFLRVLATIPLMMQARGFHDQSVWISLAIIGVDQLSLLFNWLWQRFKESLFQAFHLVMIANEARLQPQTRSTICTFLSTISDRMMFSDEVRLNFVRLRKGCVAYTMSPFESSEFEIVESPPFERKRKVAVPYTQEEFGRYKQANGELFPRDFLEIGTPIISHTVKGSRIDTMFVDDGGFYNFINNEHLHFGFWNEDRGDKENFQDLLQVMEEMQMLPIHQTDAELLKSLRFNNFLSQGKRLEDLTFVKVKRNSTVGGKV